MPPPRASPIFFGGVSTYLREKFPLLRRMPRWLDRLLSHRALLRLLAGKAAAQTGGPDVAELTLSMLRGEEGNQAGEIEELVAWLRDARPARDVCGFPPRCKRASPGRFASKLGVPVMGFLQGEDTFLDGLGEPWSSRVWALLAERMRDADLWIAPSQYFADLMAKRLGWSAEESAPPHSSRAERHLPGRLQRLTALAATYPPPPASDRLSSRASFPARDSACWSMPSSPSRSAGRFPISSFAAPDR